MKTLLEIVHRTSIFNCNLSTLELFNEKKIFYMKCQMCGDKLKLSNNLEYKLDVNEEVVAGIMTIGAGITQCRYDCTNRNTKKLVGSGKKLHRVEVGKEEKEHTLSTGSSNDDGLTMILVSGEACWSKRSCGTNYL